MEKAIAEFRNAVLNDPDLPEAQYNLGLVLQSSGKESAAATEFAEAYRLSPELRRLSHPQR